MVTFVPAPAVPRVVGTEEVRVVNAPVFGATEPIGGGDAKSALREATRSRVWAPVVKVIELSEEVRVVNAGFAPVDPQSSCPLVPAAVTWIAAAPYKSRRRER